MLWYDWFTVHRTTPTGMALQVTSAAMEGSIRHHCLTAQRSNMQTTCIRQQCSIQLLPSQLQMNNTQHKRQPWHPVCPSPVCPAQHANRTDLTSWCAAPAALQCGRCMDGWRWYRCCRCWQKGVPPPGPGTPKGPELCKRVQPPRSGLQLRSVYWTPANKTDHGLHISKYPFTVYVVVALAFCWIPVYRTYTKCSL